MTGYDMVLHRPHPGLRGLVSRIAGFADHSEGTVLRRQLPSAGVPLILGFGERIALHSRTSGVRYTSFLTGMHEMPVTTVTAGSLRCLQIDLTPLGAHQLLGVPSSELTDLTVGLDTLRHPAWHRLDERLAALAGWPARFALVERTLGALAEDGRPADPEVAWAWHRLRATHGGTTVGELAGQVGWSRRHLTARFHRQVGLAPKPAGQVLRFGHALELLIGRQAASISEVAAEAGYADHSHLVREFRRLAEATPSRVLTEPR
ncbi:MAG TPA: helix-turn-helix domain-containing protein [Pseudonocardia sp.]